jgi:hypothetical protein
MKLSAVFSPFFIECMMLRDNNYPWLFFLFLEKRKQTSLPCLALASAGRKSESYYSPSF